MLTHSIFMMSDSREYKAVLKMNKEKNNQIPGYYVQCIMYS